MSHFIERLRVVYETETQVCLYLHRPDGLEKQLLCGKISGVRSIGRQRTKYTESLNRFITQKQLPINELIRRYDNRDEWRAMIADVCSRPGTLRRRRIVHFYSVYPQN